MELLRCLQNNSEFLPRTVLFWKRGSSAPNTWEHEEALRWWFWELIDVFRKRQDNTEFTRSSWVQIPKTRHWWRTVLSVVWVSWLNSTARVQAWWSCPGGPRSIAKEEQGKDYGNLLGLQEPIPIWVSWLQDGVRKDLFSKEVVLALLKGVRLLRTKGFQAFQG